MAFLLGNPVKDEALSGEEQGFASGILHAYGEMVRKGETMFSGFCQERGVPESVCIRVMIQVALHRAGTNAAHLLAMLQTPDEAVASESDQLAARLTDTLAKQILLSRETDKRTRPANAR